MHKITDKIAALADDSHYFSLEFFPPKTSIGFTNLRNRLDRMQQALRPLFVNVTWGAGGSTSRKSLELAELCQKDLGMTTCLHLTCTNMSKKLIDDALEEAKYIGIRNILALRGDVPRDDEYRDPGEEVDEGEEDFTWAIDLVKYIRKKYDDYFCIGVAAYPEGHAEGSHPLEQSLEHDLPYLVEKTEAGADFIMTQLFFDIDAYDKFESTLRNHPSGVFRTIPILPGLMPIQSYQMIKRTTNLSHAKVPASVMERLNAAKGDDEKVKSVGVDILSELVEQVKAIKSRSPGPKGFHFYTLNLEKAVSFILERTGLIPDIEVLGTTNGEQEEAAVENGAVPPFPHNLPSLQVNGKANGEQRQRSRSPPRIPPAGSDPYNRVVAGEKSALNTEWEVSGSEAGKRTETANSRANNLAISEGDGALGREATWDDYPNGRFGDARSPAYGEIDGYGVSLHMTPAQAIRHWGYPTTPQDMNQIFIRHMKGEISALPWSEEELMPETASIRDHLLELNSKGWWTIASQPAVNSLPSSDPTFGWGPHNGFVFQKSFVELFLPSSEWASLKAKLKLAAEKQLICYFASNNKGDSEASDANPETVTNAVTWGVFPSKEILTPTIIEELSFRAWSEEAFGILGEWAKVYGRSSESYKFLTGIREDYWLVNIIHHDFMDCDALWTLLKD